MKKKYILPILASLFTSIIATGCNHVNTTSEHTLSEFNDLVLLKTGDSMSAEQRLSMIKAEYLLENEGYQDDDDLIVIATLNQESLMDTYLDKYSSVYNNVTEYINSEIGQKQAKTIKNAQEALINKLNSLGYIEDVESSYNTLINGVSLKVKFKNVANIANISTISNVTLNETYNLPLSTSSGSDTSAIVNDVDVYDTGIFNSSAAIGKEGQHYTGSGCAVAILDSGFDCSHEVFQTQPEDNSKLLLNIKDINNALATLNAYELNKENLDLEDVYVSKKIPFVYDYADKDKDVNPYDSEHGTHVAGIIGGQSETITGVATNTQLVLMKVFPDLDSGAKTDDIVLALEDAVKLGVDAINLSLGSSCGFSREEDEDLINEVYDKIASAGISLLAAASNDYSSSFNGDQGNTNMVTNPDSATVGSPSTYTTSLSVASISGTKSKYLYCNDSDVIFFKESLSITSKENNFFEELGINGASSDKTYEYVTVPGEGLRVSYTGLDLTGKIALIRRGTNTFEEKAQLAKEHGAIACIIYNNIDGDISMSMGKSDHIPTVSISKDDGETLAKKTTGTIKLSYNYQAGPFMSDFSSWGPTPDLKLKPEITAHGGNIKSSVPGNEYDELSGTSMATPNLCGIVILIKQYIKDTYPSLSSVEVNKLCNQLLMSTADIVLNEEGNPYSPRKQGAGLASLKKVVNTDAYISVDNCDKTKLELGDDPNKTGVYSMTFNVVNLSDNALSYDLDVIGMSESVSSSDEKHVAEKSYLLNGTVLSAKVSGDGSVNDNKVTVDASKAVKVTLTYTISDEDKAYIEEKFPYGMYVEGFVTLKNTSTNSHGIDLNCPFLSFYGDWTQAPLFDKTYYDVQSEAYNNAIDDEDKIKADYYATTPYGSYYYNYMIPLGTYLYDMSDDYDKIPATTEKIAVSNILGCIDGIASVYAGLLRNAKHVDYSIIDDITGEVVWEYTDYNCQKAHYSSGVNLPYYDYIKLSSYDLGLVNNRTYSFSMKAYLDYGDGGVSNNVNNEFSFDFTMDNEAPVIKSCNYEKVYDKTLKKYRYYINMTVYDNHYVQAITPIAFTSSSTYTTLTDNPIPVYGDANSDTLVRFEITDLLDNLEYDELITSSLAFVVEDYALNSNIYLCQLPGTDGDFKFTKDGDMEGSDILILSTYKDEIIDMTKYLATSDESVDEDKSYLGTLVWTSSNEDVCEIKNGILITKASGKATIKVSDQLNGKQALVIINVKDKEGSSSTNKIGDVDESNKVTSLRFAYYDTIYAYSRAAQTSEIGSTGSRNYLETNSVSFYPGESIKLTYDFEPFYALENYTLTYKSTRPDIATVDENGVVKGLKEGTCNIVLNIEGSSIQAKIKVTIKDPFVIESRVLVAYKGIDENVVIPDDEGILYIGSYAFCLYDTDYSIILEDDDYDANKIPQSNSTIKSIVVPDGVEEIQKYAFYNLTSLESVTIPDSVKYIRDYAFYGDEKLESINLNRVIVIGGYCFYNCNLLNNIDLSRCYAIGKSAFEKCSSLESVDLSTVRNMGARAFKDTTSLNSVVMNKNTAVAQEMFVNTGLTSIDIYAEFIPSYFLATSKNIEEIRIHGEVISVGKEAFGECPKLTTVDFSDCSIEEFEDLIFYKDPSLTSITLPNNSFSVGNYLFYECENLSEIKFDKETYISSIEGGLFTGSNVTTYVIDPSNTHYNVSNNYVVCDNTILFGTIASDEPIDLVIDNNITNIGSSAFSGANIKSLTITNPNTIIDSYAFCACENLECVTLPSEGNISIGKYAFYNCTKLTTIDNLKYVNSIGDYAFGKLASDESGIVIEIGDNVSIGEGAFISSKVTKATIGKSSSIGFGCFQYCSYLKNVVLGGDVSLDNAAFALCVQLQTINLENVSEISEECFYGCNALYKADLSNATKVNDYAFADCAALSSVILNKVTYLGEGAFARYDTSSSAPIFSTVILPDTLNTIGDGAFLGCEGLTHIEIPDSVNSIGDYVFAYCVNLETVTYSSNLDYVGKYQFAGCNELYSINLGNVKTIEEMAFASCYELTSVDLTNATTIGYGAFASAYLEGSLISSKLTKVGDYAFQNTNLTLISLSALEEFGEGSFDGCAKLNYFYIPSSLQIVDFGAFRGCESLKEFSSISGQTSIQVNDKVLLEDGCLYYKQANDKYALVAIPENKDATVFEVMEGTSYIYNYAGNENKHIEYLVLPDSLESIGQYAFYGCKNLEIVEFKSYTAPILEDSYNSNSELLESDPGYELLHNAYNLFGYELYYYNFIDLVGKTDTIQIILPCNDKLVGYDNLLFEAYFGDIENAQRSDYEARESGFVNFINNVNELKKISKISLVHKELVEDTITYLNSIKQDYKKYGYSDSEWNEMIKIANDAKEEIRKLQFSISESYIKEAQTKLDKLPEHFSIEYINEFKEAYEAYNALKTAEKKLLDISIYSNIISEYESYLNGLNNDIEIANDIGLGL